MSVRVGTWKRTSNHGRPRRRRAYRACQVAYNRDGGGYPRKPCSDPSRPADRGRTIRAGLHPRDRRPGAEQGAGEHCGRERGHRRPGTARRRHDSLPATIAVIAPVAMNVATATSERGDRRESPHAVTARATAAEPRAEADEHTGDDDRADERTGVRDRRGATIEAITPEAASPPRNASRHARSGVARCRPPAIPLMPAIRPCATRARARWRCRSAGRR